MGFINQLHNWIQKCCVFSKKEMPTGYFTEKNIQKTNQ